MENKHKETRVEQRGCHLVIAKNAKNRVENHKSNRETELVHFCYMEDVFGFGYDDYQRQAIIARDLLLA